MNNTIKAILSVLSLVLGVMFFAVAIIATQPRPVLRATIDPAIHAEYDAPIANVQVDVGSIAEVRKVRTHQRATTVAGKRATAVAKTAQDSANDAGNSLQFGKFSTRAAMEYHTVQHKSRVPNVRYEVTACPLCK